MNELYVYRQIIDFQGQHLSNITFSEHAPDKCTLSEPVECLGKVALLPLNDSKDGQP